MPCHCQVLEAGQCVPSQPEARSLRSRWPDLHPQSLPEDAAPAPADPGEHQISPSVAVMLQPLPLALSPPLIMGSPSSKPDTRDGTQGHLDDPRHTVPVPKSLLGHLCKVLFPVTFALSGLRTWVPHRQELGRVARHSGPFLEVGGGQWRPAEQSGVLMADNPAYLLQHLGAQVSSPLAISSQPQGSPQALHCVTQTRV